MHTDDGFRVEWYHILIAFLTGAFGTGRLLVEAWSKRLKTGTQVHEQELQAIAVLREENTTLRRRLDELDAKVTALQTDVSEHRGQRERAEAKLVSAGTAIETLHMELASARSEAKAAHRKSAAWRAYMLLWRKQNPAAQQAPLPPWVTETLGTDLDPTLPPPPDED